MEYFIYNPANHYWFIAGVPGQVFSSAVGDYVVATDPTYLAWVAAGGQTTNSPLLTEGGLGEVLADADVAAPVAVGVLDGWKTRRAAKVVALAAFKVLFNHENRIRAIERALGLNGSPADLTVGQAAAAVKALM